MKRADVPDGVLFRYVTDDGPGPTLYRAEGVHVDVVVSSRDPAFKDDFRGHRWGTAMALFVGAECVIEEGT